MAVRVPVYLYSVSWETSVTSPALHFHLHVMHVDRYIKDVYVKDRCCNPQIYYWQSTSVLPESPSCWTAAVLHGVVIFSCFCFGNVLYASFLIECNTLKRVKKKKNILRLVNK